MVANRPAIPADVQRQIFIETGHRCAVCGTPFPLERAHIVPWNKSMSHEPENLICLCANCHEMADKDWDEKTLHEYKKKPWIHRHSGGLMETEAEFTQLEIKINYNANQFDSTQEQILKFALSKFLGINPEDVSLNILRKGSIRVFFSILSDKLKNDKMQVVKNAAYEKHFDDSFVYKLIESLRSAAQLQDNNVEFIKALRDATIFFVPDIPFLLPTDIILNKQLESKVRDFKKLIGQLSLKALKQEIARYNDVTDLYMIVSHKCPRRKAIKAELARYMKQKKWKCNMWSIVSKDRLYIGLRYRPFIRVYPLGKFLLLVPELNSYHCERADVTEGKRALPLTEE